MKAVVFYAPGDIRVEEMDIPACKSDEILVEVDACAVCGSDMKAAVSGNIRIKPPRVMGHEFTGIIVQVGSKFTSSRTMSGGRGQYDYSALTHYRRYITKDLPSDEESGKEVTQEATYNIGDRVVMATSISCGECWYCRHGHRNLCIDLSPMGYSYDGGMAEYVVIPARAIANGHLIMTPHTLSPELAALAEPVSCAVNAVEQCKIGKGDTVLVIGAGPMGILNACIARVYGASKIIFAELNDNRLKQCEQFGFDRLVNPANEDLWQVVMDETEGYGVDVAIIAAPAITPQEQALSLVRKQGTVMLFASLPVGKSMLNIDSRLIHYKELRVLGSSDSTPEHVKKAVEILSSRQFPAEKIVTHHLRFEDIEKAFELMRSGESLRVVLSNK